MPRIDADERERFGRGLARMYTDLKSRARRTRRRHEGHEGKNKKKNFFVNFVFRFSHVVRILIRGNPRQSVARLFADRDGLICKKAGHEGHDEGTKCTKGKSKTKPFFVFFVFFFVLFVFRFSFKNRFPIRVHPRQSAAKVFGTLQAILAHST